MPAFKDLPGTFYAPRVAIIFSRDSLFDHPAQYQVLAKSPVTADS